MVDMPSNGKAVVVPGMFNWLITYSPRLVLRRLTRWMSAHLLESGMPAD